MIKKIVCSSILLICIYGNLAECSDPNQKKLHILPTIALIDEVGNKLPGNNPARLTNTNYGPYVPGAVVQLISAGADNIANPPSENGGVTGDDVLISTHAIGEGINILYNITGKFDIILFEPNIPTGSIYIRVFNKASLISSTYYGQTQVVFVSLLPYQSNGLDIYFYVNNHGLTQTNIPIVKSLVADAGGPYIINEGEAISLDASNTTDADTPIENLTFQWDLDCDGLYDDAQGVSPVYTWNDNTEITIGLMVTDPDNHVSYSSAQVTVINSNPLLADLSDIHKYPDEEININTTYTDSGSDDTHTLDIDWGDGTIVNGMNVSNGTISLSHSYNVAGLYAVSITITDKDGGTDSKTLTATVYEKEIAPSIAQDPDMSFSISWNAIPGREYKIYYTDTYINYGTTINWQLAGAVIGNQFKDSGDQDGYDNISGTSDDRPHPAMVKLRLYKIE